MVECYYNYRSKVECEIKKKKKRICLGVYLRVFRFEKLEIRLLI